MRFCRFVLHRLIWNSFRPVPQWCLHRARFAEFWRKLKILSKYLYLEDYLFFVLCIKVQHKILSNEGYFHYVTVFSNYIKIISRIFHRLLIFWNWKLITRCSKKKKTTYRKIGRCKICRKKNSKEEIFVEMCYIFNNITQFAFASITKKINQTLL